MTKTFCLVAACSLCAVSGAAAQSTQGTWQVAADVPLLAYTSVSTSYESSVGTLENDRSTVEWGVYGRPFVELGYGLSDLLTVGAIVRLGGASTSLDGGSATSAVGAVSVDLDDNEVSTVDLLIAPKLDASFGDGSLKPFLGAAIGLVHRSTSSDGADTSGLGFGLILRGGVRYFVADQLSLDPQLALSYTSVSLEADSAGGPVTLAADDVSTSSVQFALLLGLSAWL